MRMFDPKTMPPARASGRERLMRLACFLETVSEDELTFSRWHGLGKGCAIGLAIAREPWFRAQGLHFSDVERFADRIPVYGELKDWDAIYAFFELGRDDAAALFAATGYGQRLRPAPSEVAAKIRAFFQEDGQADRSSRYDRIDVLQR